MYHKGKYKVKNPKKYKGDINNVVYRSSWERAVIKWLDLNDQIIEFAAEEIVIPYICATDNKKHRYFIDLYFMTKDRKKYLVEIKPEKETKPPKPGKRKTKRYIQEQLTYAKNISKWKAAKEFALHNNCQFVIWHEKIIRSMGIKLI